MPYLSKSDRESLLGPRGGTCRLCHTIRVRHYCRSCDEFFEECQCERLTGLNDKHAGHRTYRWVAGNIIADPNFD